MVITMTGDRLGHELILVVDDDEVDRAVCRRVLTAAGFAVAELEDGLGIVEAVRQHNPVLIIMDVNMPGLSGDHAARAIPLIAAVRHRAPVPVVLRSGLPAVELEQICADIAAAGCVEKDADGATLLEVVLRTLAAAADPVRRFAG